jgi:HAD superfamily hydrolase (TIGR01509 family)
VPARDVIEAVVFDMDGVLVDTEHLWDEVREALTEEWGGRYTAEAQEAMMGMSSLEWSRYLHETVGLREPPERINDEVVRRMLGRYETDLPVVPGAPDAVRRVADAGLRLGVASSSNRPLIDAVLQRLGLTDLFAVTVSSEEVARGKPAPDVYAEAARRLGVEPRRAIAVEDSASGIRAARAAGMRVVAYPNRHYPPSADVLELADVVLDSLDELTPERLLSLAS